LIAAAHAERVSPMRAQEAGEPGREVAARDRQPDAELDALFRRHEAALRGYCAFLTGDREEGLDLMQAVAVRAIVALREGHRPRSERAWLRRIAYNEAISRHRLRRPTAALDAERADAGGDPLAVILAADLLAWLLDAISRLAPQDRRVLVMAEFLGRSRAEIAASLGITQKAVSQSLARARTALRAEHAAREVPCEQVRAILSDPDARRHRARIVIAHLRVCPSCRRAARE
jgi:RNA polymerase sigma-70 factor, ECF subfamily